MMTTGNGLCYWVIEDDLDLQFLVQLKFKAESRLKFCGSATNSTDAIELVRGTNPGVVILDHFIEGQVMGLQLAPLIKAIAPNTQIILFTSHDLAVEVSQEPAIDAYLRKSDLAKLLPTALLLLGLESMAK